VPNMTVADCGEIIAVLSATYPNATFTDRSPAAWHVFLSQYDRDQVRAVLPSICKASPEFCPSAPALAKAVDDAMHPQVDTQSAWDLVHKAIRFWGSSQPDRCRQYIREHDAANADVIIAAAGSIGWQRLGTAEFKDHGTLLAQFRDHLADAARQSSTAQLRESIALTSNGATAIGGGL
jgi:hypothetical protein